MRTIYKYPFVNNGVGSTAYLSMPHGAKIIMCEKQGSVPCLWAEVESVNVPETRRFMIVATGGTVPDHAQHVGSWQEELPSGRYVWHLYESEAA